MERLDFVTRIYDKRYYVGWRPIEPEQLENNVTRINDKNRVPILNMHDDGLSLGYVNEIRKKGNIYYAVGVVFSENGSQYIESFKRGEPLSVSFGGYFIDDDTLWITEISMTYSPAILTARIMSGKVTEVENK